jgi:hypothetical protein
MSKREAYLAKTMVKNTRPAVNTAFVIANHLIHRELSMRKTINDKPFAAKIRQRSAGAGLTPRSN